MDINDLPSLLDLKPHKTSYTTQVPLWDNAWLTILLVALMGTEWIIRRKHDLP